MTKEDFQNLWNSNFAGSELISHLFKQNFAERWFRIHSLQDSKRYADNEHEWEILLSRQNEIITDLFGIETSVVMVTGQYITNDNRNFCDILNEEIFEPFSFVQLDDIKLHKIDAELYDEQVEYRPFFTQIAWKPNYYNRILREVANDNIRVFFVSFDKGVIVAPYDGGIDIVVSDRTTKEIYVAKYSEWLSDREDGL